MTLVRSLLRCQRIWTDEALSLHLSLSWLQLACLTVPADVLLSDHRQKEQQGMKRFVFVMESGERVLIIARDFRGAGYQFDSFGYDPREITAIEERPGACGGY